MSFFPLFIQHVKSTPSPQPSHFPFRAHSFGIVNALLSLHSLPPFSIKACCIPRFFFFFSIRFSNTDYFDGKQTNNNNYYYNCKLQQQRLHNTIRTTTATTFEKPAYIPNNNNYIPQTHESTQPQNNHKNQEKNRPRHSQCHNGGAAASATTRTRKLQPDTWVRPVNVRNW